MAATAGRARGTVALLAVAVELPVRAHCTGLLRGLVAKGWVPQRVYISAPAPRARASSLQSKRMGYPNELEPQFSESNGKPESSRREPGHHPTTRIRPLPAPSHPIAAMRTRAHRAAAAAVRWRRAGHQDQPPRPDAGEQAGRRRARRALEVRLLPALLAQPRRQRGWGSARQETQLARAQGG
jgi:hypothetical protein